MIDAEANLRLSGIIEGRGEEYQRLVEYRRERDRLRKREDVQTNYWS
jgi:hypothetical protein